jgi:hypothetical protein
MQWGFGAVETDYQAGEWAAPFRCPSAGLDGRLTFRLIGGRLECVGVEFHADRAISSTDLRIPWREGILAAARLVVATAEWQRTVGVVNSDGQYLSAPLGASGDNWEALRGSDSALAPMAPEAADVAELVSERIEEATSAKAPARGRPSLGDDHYRDVARVYREAWGRGELDPTGAVARHFGTISKTTAGKRVHTARRLGYLGPATPRRAGI